MSQSRYVAVFDVGKTNKKVLIYDEQLQLVDSAYQSFEEYVENDIHFEDIEGMTAWLKERLRAFASKYHIAAISVATHGATVVCVGADGEPAVPAVAYTTDPGPRFDADFYAQCGDPRQLQRTTATAAFGLLLNAAKTVRFAQATYPDRFKNVKTVLAMPQYFGHVLTGKTGAEPTYGGCHTYLLDFTTRQYSSVVDSLGIRDKLPPLSEKSWQVLGTVHPDLAVDLGLPSDCIVTMGIHDSNSSLLPYLVKGHQGFVLNSTGTWCVAMHPTNEVRFREEELGKLVFYNLDAFFNPVKTSIFMGGQEFDTYRTILTQSNGRDDHPEFDLALFARIVAERKLFILPSVVKGTGLFPDSLPRVVEGDAEYSLDEIRSGARVPRFFDDFETANAVLNISLAVQTSVALDMAGYDGQGAIFSEGGFRKNGPYNAMLSAIYPRAGAHTTRLEEATAFGAALLGKAALDGTSPMSLGDLFTIEMVEVDKPRVPGIEAYVKEFKQRVAGS